jgi:hypothetical protein
METRREILARAVIKAWRDGKPDGLLLRALYQECGMSKEDAIKYYNERKH